MGYTLTEKILREHLADGSYEPGKEICIKIDKTLTQIPLAHGLPSGRVHGLSDIATSFP